MCCTVPIGPGLCFISFPGGGGSLSGHPLSALKPVSKSCFHLSLCPGWGTGPAPLLDQSCQKAARPLLDPILMAVATLNLSPSKPQTTRGNRAWWAHKMSDETTLLVPGSGSHRAPTRGYLTSEGMFLKMNLKVSQQILHSKEKKRPLFCAKNCGHAGSASSGPSH